IYHFTSDNGNASPFLGMYTRVEASRIKHEFWMTFGKYMAPVTSAQGTTINWVNYHTGVKGIFFRMHADHGNAFVAITIEQYDASVRELYFQKFLQFETLLHEELGEEWEWHRETTDDNGRLVSRIQK